MFLDLSYLVLLVRANWTTIAVDLRMFVLVSLFCLHEACRAEQSSAVFGIEGPLRMYLFLGTYPAIMLAIAWDCGSVSPVLYWSRPATNDTRADEIDRAA